MPRHDDADPERPTAEQLAAAVQLLSRTLPAPEAGEGRWVRHAPEQGLMLRTRLDAAGRPERQELHVLGEAFVWQQGQGVQTARSHWEAGEPQARADAQPLADRLALAARALAGYAGEDALVLHLRAQLVQAHARQPRAATSTSYYPREGLVYAVLFALFTLAFLGALFYFAR
jgi:hypothetical protein